ncbi:MAG: bifunctional 2-methylcitrate dehydratase/aconitate hydratase [Gammaproteobacteria bacterium]
MSNAKLRNAERPPPDPELVAIARYVLGELETSAEVRDTARLCFMDALGCGLLALSYPACAALLGPIVEGAEMPGGARVPGTSFQLDPVRAAFNIGCAIRWLDYNDTWIAAEWGHPSDNIGGVLAVADWLSPHNRAAGQAPLLMRDVLTAMIKAYEIQGVLALDNAFNRVGLDHVLLVRIASTAVVSGLLGCNLEQVINAVSNAWLDGAPLRVYRQAPNTGSRKSWAAGDATSRGVWHALNALRGEMGYPSALSTPQWGFQEVLNRGLAITRPRAYGTYVMENVLFKISFPAEFHGQTACEAAVRLHPLVRDRLGDISHVLIETQESALRIIDKTGPLANPADRDHCLQYMVAVCLIRGDLTAADYEQAMASDPRIDRLRGLTNVRENANYVAGYRDPDRRSIGNAVQVFFTDGTATPRIEIEYPIGHWRRRTEALPLLRSKLERNLASRLTARRVEQLMGIGSERTRFEAMSVPDFIDLTLP